MAAVIGVPNDPCNEGRALKLLQAQGIIKLRPDVGLLPTALDIADNPKHIQIKELDAGIVGRSDRRSGRCRRQHGLGDQGRHQDPAGADRPGSRAG